MSSRPARKRGNRETDDVFDAGVETGDTGTAVHVHTGGAGDEVQIMELSGATDPHHDVGQQFAQRLEVLGMLRRILRTLDAAAPRLMIRGLRPAPIEHDRTVQDDMTQVSMMQAPAVAQTMLDRIVDRFRPRRVSLFGSHARGTATAASDVDLLVVFDHVSDKRRAAIEIRRALSDLPLSKDIIVTTPEEIARRGHLPGSILRPALAEGRTIYEQR